MFEGFQSHLVDVHGVKINCVVGGNGPPILLLHGYPQTLAMWHKVAPLLCEDFTLIAADLRGYGKSSKPASTPDHRTYSKRAMAADMVRLMDHFGHNRFGVLGHDRGARVAHRLALDWPENVSSMILLDIAPTGEMSENPNDGFARTYWHWFSLIQPAPFPEKMIQADPKTYWLTKCG
ncbi:MAG: alpha/beta fold hydrolase, partial [Paracoccaceae bacterium]